MRVEIPLKSTKLIGERGTIAIPLLATSLEALLWQYGTIAILFSFTLFRHMFIPTTWKIFLILGNWTEGGPLGYVPSGGLIYWLLPPFYFPDCKDRFRLCVYGAYIITSCVLAAWCTLQKEDHDYNPVKMAEDLLGPTGVTRAGKYSGEWKDGDEALRSELQKVIPAATVVGGVILGTLCVFCDMLHLLGGGHSLLGLTIIVETYLNQARRRRIN